MRMKRADYLESLARAARLPLWVSIFIIILDIGMMVVAIMAYTGAQSSDDSESIRDTYITWPDSGHHIQRLEIALPSLSLVTTIVLAVLVAMRLKRLSVDFNQENLLRAQRLLAFVFIPWYSASLIVWAVCVGFQSSYVPLLDANILPECTELGNELTQCGMVSGSWVLAMVECVTDIIMIVLGLNIFFMLRHPTFSDDRQPKYYHYPSNRRHPSVAPSVLSSRPPSYRTSEAPPSYRYHGMGIPLNDRDAPPRLDMLREESYTGRT